MSAVSIAVAALVASPATAVTGNAFRAGNIISDAVFYNASALSSGQIQSFIQSKEPRCQAGYTCLAQYRSDSFTRAADSYCGAYGGAAGQLASEIIFGVAQACGINPQVLIVMLEKEQGLVSSTAPTAGRYRIAMGYGCPDTAPCDQQYYGFYNQVYNAARQFQRYRKSPNSWNYRAGRYNAIQWSPNGACGSSQVYIENQATAALYIYTPYQPNAAALANLYGTGDGCSAYGNRNFWRTFYDWFGDPQGGGYLVKTAGSDTVWLVTDLFRYPIPDAAMLQNYIGLGPYRTVSQDYLNGFGAARSLGRLVRDPLNGSIFYTDGGVRHFVTTCEQLVDFGTDCSSYVNLTTTQLSRLPLGSGLSNYVRQPATGKIWLVTAGTKRLFLNLRDLLQTTGGSVPAFTDLSDWSLASIPDGADVVVPGDVVSPSPSGSTYLVEGGGVAVPIAPGSVDQFPGRRGVINAAAWAQLRVDTRRTVGLVILCGSTRFWVGGGVLTPLSGSSGDGVATTALDGRACAALDRDPLPQSAPVIARASDSGRMYAIRQGARSFIPSMAAVYALAGPAARWVATTEAALATLPNGPTILQPGSLVKSSSSPSVYMVDGTASKVPVDSFSVPAEFGATGYLTVSDSDLATYTTFSRPLSVFVSCDGEQRVAGSGLLWTVPSSASTGVVPVPLTPSTCAAFPRGEGAGTGDLLVRSRAGAIYIVTGGQKRFVTSMGAAVAASGDGPVSWVTQSDDVLGRLADGAPVYSPGTLVKTAASPTVYFVSGPRDVVPVADFPTAAEFGSTGWRTVPESALAGYRVASVSLGALVQCGSQSFIAGSGRLYRLGSGSGVGLAPVTMTAAACSTLPQSGTVISGEVWLRGPDGRVYLLSSGQRRFATSMTALLSRTGGRMPDFVPLSTATISRIPSGPDLG